MSRLTWNVHGRRCEVGKLGDAYTLKAWNQGVPVYGLFCSIEAIYAYIQDFGSYLDRYKSETITVKLDIAA